MSPPMNLPHQLSQYQGQSALGPALLKEAVSKNPYPVMSQEMEPSSVPPSLDLASCHVFNPDCTSHTGTDHTANIDPLMQLFMAELGSELAPSSSPVPSLTSLSSVPNTPVPTPPAQAPTCPPPPSPPVPVATPPADIDDPLLVSFADLDGLLNDSTLFETTSPTPSSDSDTPMFPFPESHIQDPLLLDLSDCLSLSLSPLSDQLTPLTSDPCPTPLNNTPTSLTSDPCPTPLNDTPTSLTSDPCPTPLNNTPNPLTSDLCSPPSTGVPCPARLAVIHDHTYAMSEQSSSINSDNQRKRKTTATTLSTEAVLDSDVICIGDSPSKKLWCAVRDDKYLVRRQKNNVASQVSRSKRRARHRDMFTQVEELEQANACLREQVREMEAEANQLRKSLVQKLSA